MINSYKQENRSRGTVLFPIEYYKCNTEESTWNLPLHWHVDFELIHVLEGEYYMFVSDKVITLKVDDVCFLSSGVLHGDGDIKSNCRYESVVFNPDMLVVKHSATEEIVSKLIEGVSNVAVVFNSSNKNLHELSLKILHEVREARFCYEFYTLGFIFELLGEVISQNLYTENRREDFGNSQKLIWLKCVLNLIKQKYNTDISLGEMADAAGFSPKYFCRLFHKVTKYTPFEYLNQYRIKRAAEMLHDTNDSIENIAYGCGFNDISYFIKLFKRYKEMTPFKYRAMLEKEKSSS